MLKRITEKQIYHTILYFVFYAFVGWIYEVSLCIFEAKIGFVNRGFLWLPILPVYGFGSLLFIQLYRLRKKKLPVGSFDMMPVVIFLIILVSTTVVELITSYILEAAIGGWLWDYTGYFMNFEGRISLKTSLRFGLGGMAIIYILHPLLRRALYSAPIKVLRLLCIIFLTAVGIDLCFRVKYGSNFKQASAITYSIPSC
ncbi:MAG: putative ABC transporter permease [Lachnospiraceae bacterium]|nr:putative ABC transporter permease [Lachnospiraceae bacterium]